MAERSGCRKYLGPLARFFPEGPKDPAFKSFDEALAEEAEQHAEQESDTSHDGMVSKGLEYLEKYDPYPPEKD